jgi:hypothetical protein
MPPNLQPVMSNDENFQKYNSEEKKQEGIPQIEIELKDNR